jgi:K+-transporting ATPase ATPase A chain
MNANGWLQLLLYVGVLTALTKPIGAYLVQVLDPRGRTWLDPVIRPFERWTYRLLGVAGEREQDWRGYGMSMLVFSGIGLVFTYALLRLQAWLPMNPQGFGGMGPDQAFNTAVSFTTNTNWQNYGGESTLSYFSQMVGLTLHNFASAAVGITIAAALVRSLARLSTQLLGNFWVDLVRVHYYLLIPASLALALFLVSQGMIQNLRPYTQAVLVEPFRVQVETRNDAGETLRDADGQPVMEERTVTEQWIPQGPMASQVAIKMLGTNGGGFMNANAAHPFENPTPLTNFVQMLAIFAIGSGLTQYLGRATGNPAHGWAVWSAMMVLFVVGVLVCWRSEAAGNPIHHALGVMSADGNMEGKEVRFGVMASALFATITTAASCGAVNAMHDSFTAIGGLVPLFNMELGEVVIGGVGAGLYGMLVFVVLAVFIAGLMVGRTPEYLGKKIEAFDVKMSMLALLVVSVTILGFAAWAAVSPWGKAGPNDSGPHGFSEILYAFSSAAGNNGSAFGGLSANTLGYNTTLGLAMLAGRFLMIVPILALAGSLAAKKRLAVSAGSFPVSGVTFTVLLIGTVLLFGALNFLPALALGPIVEHFLTVQGSVF